MFSDIETWILKSEGSLDSIFSVNWFSLILLQSNVSMFKNFLNLEYKKREFEWKLHKSIPKTIQKEEKHQYLQLLLL